MATFTGSRQYEWSVGAKGLLEVEMPISRKEARGGKAFAFPLFGIMFLLTCYWVLADWQSMPLMLSNVLAAVHWPS